MTILANFKEKIKCNKWELLSLLVLIAIGIFLRTYNFHDWLRFSQDQARDAAIISAAIENRDSLPLLGPDAGSTHFHLGPMYYYLSYITAKIFGNNPVAMALPSLFSGIVAIPLLFLFLREYFDKKISLALMTIMSVSYFFVSSSRFSSNPNLVPFFLLLCLYSLLKIANGQKGKNVGWSILLGFGLGMGIQMHTTFLIIIPAVSFCVFIYLLKNKIPGIWKSALVVLTVVIILNASQLLSEVQSNWHNSKNFISGFTHSSSDNTIAANIIPIAACQIRANAFMLSSLGDDVPCGSILNSSQNAEMAMEILFSLAGYFLLGYKLKIAKEAKKKNFLTLVIALNLIAFMVFIPIARIMVVGYFIIIFVVPFVLLGLLLETIEKNHGRLRKPFHWQQS